MGEHEERASDFLEALKSPGARNAWRAFHDRTRPVILKRCRKHGLQHSDAEDVASEVFIRVLRFGGRFEWRGEGSLHGWIGVITENLARDLRGKRRRESALVLGHAAARTALDARVDAASTHDDGMAETSARALLAEAEDRARRGRRIDPKTWLVHDMLQQGASVRLLEQTLGLERASIHQAKSRILRAIRQEVAALSRRHGRGARASGKIDTR